MTGGDIIVSYVFLLCVYIYAGKSGYESDYPEGLDELEFWSIKAATLNSIYRQLQADPVRRLLKVGRQVQLER